MISELKIVARSLKESAKSIKFSALFLFCLILALMAEILPLLVPLYMDKLQKMGGQPLDVFAFCIIFVYGPVKVLSFIFKNLVNIFISGPLASCFALASNSYVEKLIFSPISRSNTSSASQVSAAVQQAQESFSGVIFISIFLLLPKLVGIIMSFWTVSYFLGITYFMVLLLFVIAYFALLRRNITKIERSKKIFGKRHASFCGMIEELWNAREFILINGEWDNELARFDQEVEERRKAETAIFHRLGYFELQQSLLIGITLSVITLLAFIDYKSGVITMAGTIIAGSAVKHFALPFKECSRLICNLMKHLAYLGNWAKLESLSNTPGSKIFCVQDDAKDLSEAMLEKNSGENSIIINKVILKKERKIVLDELSILFPANGLHGITGPNGCGKTSLIRSIIGLESLTAGAVNIFDKDINNLSWCEKSKLFGYVEQNPKLLRQTIDYNLFYGINEVSLQKYILDKMQDFLGEDLWSGVNRWVGFEGENLSKGAIAKIRIVQAILKNPKILLLDEPTNSLDIASQKKLLLALRQLAPLMTIIIATHNAEFLADCDSVFDFKVLQTADRVKMATEYQQKSL